MIEVLGPVDEVQVAVLVGHRDVAGAQPAVRRRAPAPSARGRRGSREDVRPLHPDLARVTESASSPASSTMRTSIPSSTLPTDPNFGGSAGRTGHDRRRLGQAVALGDAQPEALLQPLGDRFLGHLRRAGQREADGGEAVGRRLVEVANASHIGGAPGITVTPRSWIDSSAVDGSKRCTSTTVAPCARLSRAPR